MWHCVHQLLHTGLTLSAKIASILALKTTTHHDKLIGCVFLTAEYTQHTEIHSREYAHQLVHSTITPTTQAISAKQFVPQVLTTMLTTQQEPVFSTALRQSTQEHLLTQQPENV